MRKIMKNTKLLTSVSLALTLCLALPIPFATAASGPTESAEVEPEKGPHRGRMLRDGDFAVELAIFETGVPPEFRVWLTDKGNVIAPQKVKLNVKLTRLGDVIDDINFRAQGDFLRGDSVIYEPHSFYVTVTAQYKGTSYRWEYENYEGRTTIEQAVADAMEIKTEIAGEATLHQSIPAYGVLAFPPNAHTKVSARFDGEITQRHVNFGDKVKKGQRLFTIESNESLKPYTIKAPATGVITSLMANEGEQTKGRTLITLTTTGNYIARLAVYPSDYDKVKVGSDVSLRVEGSAQDITAKVTFIEPEVRRDQARIHWVNVNDAQDALSVGSFVNANINVANIAVPLAVKKIGLQAFRDFTVVYAKVGEQYEVRMLELGREGGEWIEVLGGLEPGTEYVTENSFVLKADIEKSGASHDH